MNEQGAGLRRAAWFESDWLQRAADILVVLVAISLPWSTSGTAILVVIWLCVAAPTLRPAAVRREIMTPEGGLPVLLFALGAAGTLWADVSYSARFGGLDSLFKLLVIPILFAQFREPKRGWMVLAGYIASCAALLIASYIWLAWQFLPSLEDLPRPSFAHGPGIPVKDYLTQSGEFVICAFALLRLSLNWIESKRYGLAALAAILVIGFAGDVFFVATGRTTIVIIVVLFCLFAVKNFSARNAVIVFVCGAILAGATWMSSSYLRYRVDLVWSDIQAYQASGAATSAGERLSFWQKSFRFLGEAPLFGHGTGSIPSMYKQAVNHSGAAAAETTANPHNQTVVMAIQWGLAGVLTLWAMWLVHLWMFRGAGTAAWIGLVVVTQNVVGSLFNSHLSDFTQGWTYVFGVGVAGAVIRQLVSSEQQTARGRSGQ